MMSDLPVKPFLKWAGGKRWLFTNEFVTSLPPFERYIEPFLGGGAGFFALSPQRAILSDVNPELINCYVAIREAPEAISRGLKFLHGIHSEALFYKVRERTYRPGVAGAVRTLYLNRTCWNGLYRLNRQGQFNVPVGTKSLVFNPDEDLSKYSKRLKSANIVCQDFEISINESRKGDLIFVDPPYTVKHNMNGFVKYNEAIFTWCDQIRLANALKRAQERGASIVLTNADHQSIRDLYSGMGLQRQLARASIISGRSHGRSKTTEFLMVA